tara:strand:+ start:256 stop:867 length:612 start_codon:yes stop_codon:yes gene_type:complete
VKKIRFDDCICKSRIREHDIIKDELLSLIGDTASQSIKEDDDGSKSWNIDPNHVDRMAVLDWDSSYDSSRPWVQKFFNLWFPNLRDVLKSMGYTGVEIRQCWFQQYEKGDQHGWHIHGAQFTGVYYLEFPSKSARTEICSPYSKNIKKVNVKEGDFIVFPSHWIHRAPPNTSERKTIVSYNFNVITEPLRMDLIEGGKPYILF